MTDELPIFIGLTKGLEWCSVLVDQQGINIWANNDGPNWDEPVHLDALFWWQYPWWRWTKRGMLMP